MREPVAISTNLTPNRPDDLSLVILQVLWKLVKVITAVVVFLVGMFLMMMFTRLLFGG